ncbi:hypothetical protein ABTN15_19720, partial [Acinetobacter baumannii]
AEEFAERVCRKLRNGDHMAPLAHPAAWRPPRRFRIVAAYDIIFAGGVAVGAATEALSERVMGVDLLNVRGVQGLDHQGPIVMVNL